MTSYTRPGWPLCGWCAYRMQAWGLEPQCSQSPTTAVDWSQPFCPVRAFKLTDAALKSHESA